MSARVTRVLRLMKTIPLLGSAVLVALAASARADDARRIAAKSIPPKYHWTGVYLGINAGYGLGKSQTDALFSDASGGSPLFATGASSKLDGAIIGAQAGYNWQSGIWLIGLETDIDATTQRATTAYFCPGTSCNPTLAGFDATVGIWQRQKLDWFSTLRGRLGATVMPNALIYATGGAAVAGISHVGTIFGSSLAPLLDANGNPVLDGNGNPINTTASATAGLLTHTTKTGWVVGAGAETRLIGNWTAKIEYLHLDFGRDSIGAANPLNQTPLAVGLNSRITDDIVRIGLNYRLASNGVAAPVYMIPARSYRTPVEAVWNWTGLYIGMPVTASAGRRPMRSSATPAWARRSLQPLPHRRPTA